MNPQQGFNTITNTKHGKLKDRGIEHPFFNTTTQKDIEGDYINSSNIIGYKYNKYHDEYDRRIVDNLHSQKDIGEHIAKFNKYYSDQNFSSAHNMRWGDEGLEKRVGYEGGAAGGHRVNGRVEGIGKKYIPSFHSNQDNEQSIYNNFASESVKGNFDQTELSRFYFSEQNVTNLQMRIRERVYKLSQSKYYFVNILDNNDFPDPAPPTTPIIILLF